jgi:hypothetical protein
LQVGHTSRRAIEAMAVKENIDSKKREKEWREEDLHDLHMVH